MDHLSLKEKEEIMAMLICYLDMLNQLTLLCILFLTIILSKRVSRGHIMGESTFNRLRVRQLNFYRLIHESDLVCFQNTRLNRRTFTILCHLLKTIGKLNDGRNIQVEEMVAIFLYIIAHDLKNRVISRYFVRSGETVSRCFNLVLNSILQLHEYLLKKPEPVLANSSDGKWRWFKNCLGALDGTYVKVNVSVMDRPRYRTRKNEIATNVLGVCSQNMEIIYVLPGWEGSASDSRVLRDAISRRDGLKGPKGFYYLCDAGYTNGEGFLAPYRGQRYHLNDWRQGHMPTTPKEFFNMKHSSARNVIERTFGLLKGRWAILRSKSYYPVKIQTRIITACCLIHNLIRREMPSDLNVDDLVIGNSSSSTEAEVNPITHVETSNEWTVWRDNLAQEMYDEWISSMSQ